MWLKHHFKGVWSRRFVKYSPLIIVKSIKTLIKTDWFKTWSGTTPLYHFPRSAVSCECVLSGCTASCVSEYHAVIIWESMWRACVHGSAQTCNRLHLPTESAKCSAQRPSMTFVLREENVWEVVNASRRSLRAESQRKLHVKIVPLWETAQVLAVMTKLSRLHQLLVVFFCLPANLKFGKDVDHPQTWGRLNDAWLL